MSFLNIPISGWFFSNYEKNKISPFEKLLEIFKELLTHTSGDFNEAIDWLRELDKEYKLTDEDYTIDDFINDLLEEGYIIEEIGSGEGNTIRNLIEIVSNYFDIDYKSFTKVDENLLREGDPSNIVSNPSLIRQNLGWETRTSFESIASCCRRQTR